MGEIRLLGGVEISNGEDRCLRFSTRQTAALLAILAFEVGNDVPKAALVEELWSHVEPAKAKHSLNQAISSLRRTFEQLGLGSDRLVVSLGKVRLQAEGLAIDVNSFEAAVRRLEREAQGEAEILKTLTSYQGEFAPGLTFPSIERMRSVLRGRHQALLKEGLRRAREAENSHVVDLLEAIQTSHPGALPAPALEPSPTAISHRQIPVPLTRFFGREHELDQLLAAIDGGARLVTVVGIAGIGKTRVLLKMAERLAEKSLKVHYLDLDQEGAANLFSTLSNSLSPGLATPASVFDALQSARVDVLMMDAVADSFHTAFQLRMLAERMPSLVLVVAARTMPNTPGEVRLALGPLPTPDEAVDLRAALPYAGVQMVLDRFGIPASHFDADTVGLCRRLDGYPIAIELASNWAGLLQPSEIAERLTLMGINHRGDESMKVGTGQLRSIIEQNVKSLSEERWSQIQYLSAFERSFALEDAAKFLGIQADSLIAECVDTGILRRADNPNSGGRPRFAMVAIIREYVLSTITRVQWLAICRRHGQLFVDLSQIAMPGLEGENRREWLARLSFYARDIVAAVDRLERTGEPQVGCELLWNVRTFLLEQKSPDFPILLRKILRNEGSDPVTLSRASLLYGITLLQQSLLGEANEALLRSCELADECKDPVLIAESNLWHAKLRFAQGQIREAREKILAARKVTLEADPILAIDAEVLLGRLSQHEEAFDDSIAHYREAIALARGSQDTVGVGIALQAMSQVWILTGKPLLAEPALLRAREIAETLDLGRLKVYVELTTASGHLMKKELPRAAEALLRAISLKLDPDLEVSFAIRTALLLDLSKQHRTAAALAASADFLAKSGYGPILKSDQRDRDAVLARAQSLLSLDEYSAALLEGEILGKEKVLDAARKMLQLMCRQG